MGRSGKASRWGCVGLENEEEWRNGGNKKATARASVAVEQA
jgi:hypothetical protein